MRARLQGLEEDVRSGRPPTYSTEQRSAVINTALTRPEDLGLPFASWTLDRLVTHLAEQGIAMRRSRISEIFIQEGLAARGDLVRRAGRPRLRPKKGAIEQLYTAPASGSVVVCLDEMGPQASKSYPGRRLVRPAGPKAERARQEIDYGRRGIAGYIFGALQPASGEAFTLTFERRTTVNWVDFLSAVERWVDPAVERIYAVLDNLNIHSAPDVLLFSLLHPRWEFVFQPKYAAYLNLIEPWWKVLRSLARKGRRFEGWAEIENAIACATAYWNDHRHPFIWGRRRRHRQSQRLGIAAVPNLTLI